MDLAQAAAVSGNPQAQWVVAREWLEAGGKDALDKALPLIAAAAHGGDTDAQAWLVMNRHHTEHSSIVTSDDIARWTEQLAADSHTGALVELAMQSEQGLDNAAAEHDHHKKSFGLLLAAAMNGDATAMRKVGEFYLIGRGCTRSKRDAFYWISQAVVSNDAGAIALMKSLLQSGGITSHEAAIDRYWL